MSVVDDPGAKDYKGTPLIGGYSVDDEGVKAEKVNVVENGTLKEMLMSRRPGNDSNQSNGHGRSALLTDAKPTMSNLFFNATETMSAADLKKKFLDECKAEKLAYCIIVREMDNPSLSLLHQEDFSGAAGKLWRRRGNGRSAAAAGVQGLSRRWARGNDSRRADRWREYAFVAESRGHRQRQLRLQLHAEPDCGLLGHGAGRVWRGANGGLPASMVAPSLLFEELEVRGARGEPKRLPLLPAPPLNAAK